MKRIAIIGSNKFKNAQNIIPKWLTKTKEKFVNDSNEAAGGIILMYIKGLDSQSDYMSPIITNWALNNKVKVEMFMDASSSNNNASKFASYTTDHRHKFLRNQAKKNKKNNNNKQEEGSLKDSSSFAYSFNVKKQVIDEADLVISFWDEDCELTEKLLNYSKSKEKKALIVFEDNQWKHW